MNNLILRGSQVKSLDLFAGSVAEDMPRHLIVKTMIPEKTSANTQFWTGAWLFHRNKTLYLKKQNRVSKNSLRNRCRNE